MENPNSALLRERLDALALSEVFYVESDRVFPVRLRVRFSRWLRARVGR